VLHGLLVVMVPGLREPGEDVAANDGVGIRTATGRTTTGTSPFSTGRGFLGTMDHATGQAAMRVSVSDNFGGLARRCSSFTREA
jgi:hypothetical protein